MLSRGFTIVELLFSLTFIAFLLIFIVMTTLQTTRLYNKGMTLKSINQASRTIVEQMARDIAESANPAVYVDTARHSGILCTDATIYLWNTVSSDPNPMNNGNRYAGSDEPKRLYLVRTSNSSFCDTSGAVGNVIAYPTATGETSELLNSQTSIIDLSLSQIVGKLYRLKVSLGTTDPEGYDTTEAGMVCKSDNNGDFCAATTFERVIYAPYAP